jgi:excinuclease ABC subunit A
MSTAKPRRAPAPAAPPSESLVVEGAAEHNLKRIRVAIPKNRLVVVTGVSGSGKSSLAFDTLYAEGHRRYVVSLSTYARQFMEQLKKPAYDTLRGLSPAIAIEQRTTVVNPRSTVGTVTEIYDHLRVLYARAGTPHCPSCGRAVSSQSVDEMVQQITALPAGTRFHVMAPIVQGRKGIYGKELAQMYEMGFVRARIDGAMTELGGGIRLKRSRVHDIEVVVDSLVTKRGIEGRLRDSLRLALNLARQSPRASEAVVVHLLDSGKDEIFSREMACPRCGVNLPEMSPRLFSFNSPRGQCPECEGLGVRYEADPDRMVRDGRLSIRKGGLAWYGQRPAPRTLRKLNAVLRPYGADVDTPVEKLPKRAWKALLEGTNGHEGALREAEAWFSDEDWSEETRMRWIGPYMRSAPCEACGGARLRPEARAVRVGGLGIVELAEMDVGEGLRRLRNFSLDGNRALIAAPVLKEIGERMEFLCAVGLSYLSLSRPTMTLSGGEAQRVRLATQVGCKLRGVMYVLDEPTIGLHPRDNERLLAMLREMCGLGNTVVVVEHDEDTIRSADHVIDLGPGAGAEGGAVTAEGTPSRVARGDSLTGRYLSGRRKIPVPAERKRPARNGWLTVHGASANNLKNITARFPVGCFTAVTGVSGSGKSTLVLDVLHRAAAAAIHRAREKPGAHRRITGLQKFRRALAVDQAPLGRTPRSNPATYSGVLSPIRELFAAVPAARMRGYTKGRFSFNVKGGRCESCRGMGSRRVAMAFMPDQLVPCETCRSEGFNQETLDVRFKGASIADVLRMTVREALQFFENVPRASALLATLDEVGLGYLRLGQPAVTLSGGEAQRLRLAREMRSLPTRLAPKAKTLYLFDEPTVGLHFEDVRNLLEIVFRLRDHGHTVIMIEHHPDVVKCADHVVDLGPEGGADGGRIVARGTPEEVARTKASHTGKILKRVLSPRRKRKSR